MVGKLSYPKYDEDRGLECGATKRKMHILIQKIKFVGVKIHVCTL